MTVISLEAHRRRTPTSERASDEAPSVALATERRSPERLSVRPVSLPARAPRTSAWLEAFLGVLPEDTFSSGGTVDTPSPERVLEGLLLLAEGQRKKILVPCAALPLELAILRRGANVLISLYHTEASPEILVLDRRVPLAACIAATCERLEDERSARALVTRARGTVIADDRDTGLSATRHRGGAADDPGEGEALAFGFEAALFPAADAPRDGVSHADVHATLFGGQLWAYVRGRRVPLVRSGPIYLAVQRMVSVVSALVLAWEEHRALHVRLRSGPFLVGVRRDRKDSSEVALTLGSEDDGAVTIPALGLEEACLPVLRVASELLRALIAIDRTQARNLRVASLREEVRRLRRALRARTQPIAFTGPARVAIPPTAEARPLPEIESPSLRFAARWSAVLDGLDATSTFFCGDRLVLANERRVVALNRDDGQCLWQVEGTAQAAFLGEQALVRLTAEGGVEIRELETGDLLHRVRLSPRIGGSAFGVYVGGQGVPSMALIAEGRDRLVALDLRTGTPRFRYAANAPGSFRVRRAGRLALIVNGDGVVDAVDLLSGEVAWRFTAKGRFCFAPAVHGETVLAVAGEPGRGDAVLHGIDLATGRALHTEPLGAPIATAPHAVDDLALVALTGSRRGVLQAHDPSSGTLRWAVPDPGVGLGGGVVSTERSLIVNASSGRLTGLDPRTGEVRFARVLANPITDDVPRRLQPLVRGGALFVPSAATHVVRLTDGAPIGSPPPCDLVPDALHVDERGWVYIAEESGHVAALAPLAALRLVRG